MAEWVSIEEASRMLEVSRQSVWRWVRTGRMPGLKVGHVWMISKANVERMREWRAFQAAQNVLPMGRGSKRRRA